MPTGERQPINSGEFLLSMEVREPSARKIILDVDTLRGLIAEYKKTGKTVVLSSGIFDIIHSDHIKWLERLKSLGDVLVIDVVTDERVKMHKGDQRPINSEMERALVIAGLSSVDHVIINHSSHLGHTNLAAYTKPTLLVQKAEFRERYQSEEDLHRIESLLGETKLLFLPGVRTQGISTTDTIQKVIKSWSSTIKDSYL